jgi:hypothetical protein
MSRSVTGGLDEGGADDGFLDGAGFGDGCMRVGWDVDVRTVAGLEPRATIRDGDVDTEEQATAMTRSRTATDVLILGLRLIVLIPSRPSAPTIVPRGTSSRPISCGNGLIRRLWA